MLRITTDQIEERCVVVQVLNRESAFWTDACMKSLFRGDQLKYIDVAGMRVVSIIRCVAEQIKNDNVENVATVGVENGEFGKVGKSQILKSIVIDAVNIGKVGESETSKTGEEKERSARREIVQVNHQRTRKTQS